MLPGALPGSVALRNGRVTHCFFYYDRNLEEMLAERGMNVDHTTIYRWVQRYAPEMEKRLRRYWRNPSDLCPWHIDETYVKVNGRWAYLYRAVDNRGRQWKSEQIS
jgi:transposase-like protein